MNETPLSKKEIELIDRSRHLASRHLDIPPTPRDTLAVLRQAAEKQQEEPTGSFAWWARLAFAGMFIAAVLTGVQYVRHVPDGATVVAIAVEDDPDSYDPGIDLASWNVEIESLMTEIDNALDQLDNDESELNSLARSLLSMEESSL